MRYRATCRLQPAPMEFIGLEDTYAESGDPAALLRKYGLTADQIEAAARRIVERRVAGTKAYTSSAGGDR